MTVDEIASCVYIPSIVNTIENLSTESKLKYLSTYNHSLAPYCERFGSYNCIDGLIERVKTPVDCLIIPYDIISAFNDSGELKSEYLKTHVNKIVATKYPHNFMISPFKFISGIFEYYPKCKKYSIHYERLSDLEMISLFQLLDLKIPRLNVSFGNLSDPKYMSFTISNKLIYFVNNDGQNEPVLIRVKYGEICLTKKCKIKYADKNVFCFTTKIMKLKGIVKIDKDHYTYKYFEENILGKAIDKGLKIKSKLCIIENKDFRTISICDNYKNHYPSIIGCKAITITMNSSINKHEKKLIIDYLKNINNNCSISITFKIKEMKEFIKKYGGPGRIKYDLVEIDESGRRYKKLYFESIKSFVIQLLKEFNIKEFTICYLKSILNLNSERRGDLIKNIEEDRLYLDENDILNMISITW